MRADARTMLSPDSNKLQNGLENRTFGLLRHITEAFLAQNLNHNGELLKLYDQTGFVYLFMPWHRHALG